MDEAPDGLQEQEAPPYPQDFQQTYYPDQRTWSQSAPSHTGPDGSINGTVSPEEHLGMDVGAIEQAFQFPDSGIESDIFGLTASMHFETPYTLEEKAHRKV